MSRCPAKQSSPGGHRSTRTDYTRRSLSVGAGVVVLQVIRILVICAYREKFIIVNLLWLLSMYSAMIARGTLYSVLLIHSRYLRYGLQHGDKMYT